jgi:hypothetical protein
LGLAAAGVKLGEDLGLFLDPKLARELGLVVVEMEVEDIDTDLENTVIHT